VPESHAIFLVDHGEEEEEQGVIDTMEVDIPSLQPINEMELRQVDHDISEYTTFSEVELPKEVILQSTDDHVAPIWKQQSDILDPLKIVLKALLQRTNEQPHESKAIWVADKIALTHEIFHHIVSLQELVRLLSKVEGILRQYLPSVLEAGQVVINRFQQFVPLTLTRETMAQWPNHLDDPAKIDEMILSLTTKKAALSEQQERKKIIDAFLESAGPLKFSLVFMAIYVREVIDADITEIIRLLGEKVPVVIAACTINAHYVNLWINTIIDDKSIVIASDATTCACSKCKCHLPLNPLFMSGALYTDQCLCLTCTFTMGLANKEFFPYYRADANGFREAITRVMNATPPVDMWVAAVSIRTASKTAFDNLFIKCD
jgi:hypothetical protein